MAKNVLRDYLGNILDVIIPRYERKILYENTEGTSDKITLIDNVDNYKYLEIYTKANNDYGQTCTKIDLSQENKHFSINQIYISSTYGDTILKTAMLRISNNFIEIVKNGGIRMESSGTTLSSTWKVSITKVIGYK